MWFTAEDKHDKLVLSELIMIRANHIHIKGQNPSIGGDGPNKTNTVENIELIIRLTLQDLRVTGNDRFDPQGLSYISCGSHK